VRLKDTSWSRQERTAKEKHLTIPRIHIRAAARRATIDNDLLREAGGIVLSG